MTTPSLALHALLGLGALLALGAATQARGEPPVKEQLRAVAERRIFFGHQSVGANVVEGLQLLGQREGVPLRIGAALPAGQAGTFAHAAVGENGQPLLKLDGFARAVGPGGAAAGADLAFVKFCYVDIREDTDVAALFAAYQRTVAALKASSPTTTLLHVTVPLQAVEGGVKGWAKRMAGKPLWGTQHNARREEFNELLRREYGGKAPLFDLARVESTRPDGSAETSAWQGREVRALVPAYTDDGGHLNEEGRLRAARELVAVIAAAPRAPVQAAR